MPVVWNTETEAKLLAGIFKVCDLKVSGAQMKELAELIGPDCTPKAVTHRIAKFRTQASAFNGGKSGAAAAAAAAAEGEENVASVSSTPAAGKKGAAMKTSAKKTPAKAAKKRKIAEADVGIDDEEGEKKETKGRVKSEEVVEEGVGGGPLGGDEEGRGMFMMPM